MALRSFFIIGVIVALGAILANAIPARAAELQPGRSEKVREVFDGDTVLLENGRQVRILGLQAPKLHENWPLAAESKAALEKLCLGRIVQLQYGETRADRHGRILAHLYTDKGVWIEGEMLHQGMARVYTFPDNRALARDMQRIEQQARAAKKGIWAHPFYRVRKPEDTPQDMDSFQLIEGRILDVAEVKRNYYLNFGDDWRRDFTVMIPYKSRRFFREDKISIPKLEAKRIRVRGWIHEKNGPMIEATHAEMVEVLE